MINLVKNNNNKINVNLSTIISKKIEIDDTDLDGEKVMMNLDKGQYFMMNNVGSRIWDLIEKPIGVNKIIEALLNEYEVDRNICESTVIDFIRELTQVELINIK